MKETLFDIIFVNILLLDLFSYSTSYFWSFVMSTIFILKLLDWNLQQPEPQLKLKSMEPALTTMGLELGKNMRKMRPACTCT